VKSKFKSCLPLCSCLCSLFSRVIEFHCSSNPLSLYNELGILIQNFKPSHRNPIFSPKFILLLHGYGITQTSSQL
jgi:retron-type reverse transcriptase